MHTPATRARALAKLKERRSQWFAANGPCQSCGSWESLELHHKNPEEKEHHTVWSWSDEHRMAELAKCEVLCHTCHKLLTAIWLMIPLHGYISTYKNGCRCALCQAVKAVEKKKYHGYEKKNKSMKGSNWPVNVSN